MGDWHGRLAQGNAGRSSLNRRFARAGACIQVLSFLMREAINGNQHAIRKDQSPTRTMLRQSARESFLTFSLLSPATPCS